MACILTEGNDLTQNISANNLMQELIHESNKRVLYIPFANNNASESNYNILKKSNLYSITTLKSTLELKNIDFNSYSAIYIEGNEVIVLYDLFKTYSLFDKFKDYLENDGIVYCLGSVSKILGSHIKKKSLNSIDEALEFEGINSIFGYSLYFCSEKDLLNHKTLKEIYDFKNSEVLIVPNNKVLLVDKGIFKVIDNSSLYVYEQDGIIQLNALSSARLKKFDLLNTPLELLSFMNNNIVYGWVDDNNSYHLNNLNNFRKLYKTNTLENILEFGVGTCLE